MTLSRQQVVHLLDQHGVRPSRALGQNFVADANTVRRIARLAEVGPGTSVVEVGAGLGSLTVALAATGATVTAVEIDRRLLPALHQVVQGLHVQVVEADALRLDWTQLLGDGCWSLVANLPYNVAVPVVVRVLDHAPNIERLVVMVQREVGLRLAARVGDAHYGAVSVKVAYHAEASVVGSVPATVFVPRPRVESVLVAMRRRPAVAVDPAEVSAERLFAVVRAGFSQRRKMLRGSLATVVDRAAFADAGVDPTWRAEQLDVTAWGRLARCGPST